VKFHITGRGWSSIVTIEDGTVKDVDNDSIEILRYKNWEHVQKKCAEWGWEVEEIPEISVYDVVTPEATTFICHTPTTIEACWPFPKEWITTDI